MDVAGLQLLDSRKMVNEQVSEFILGTSIIRVTEKDFYLDTLLLYRSRSCLSAPDF